MSADQVTQSLTVSQDLTAFELIFVHSEVDDAGLTPAEFRVYCHLARRALSKPKGKNDAYPGIRGMAEICCLNKDTVVAAIAELERRKMIAVSRVGGMVNHYKVTSKSDWLSETRERSLSETREHYRPLKPDGLSETRERTVRNEGTKGNPSKGIQEGNPSKGVAWGLSGPGVTETMRKFEEAKRRISAMSLRPGRRWTAFEEHTLIDLMRFPSFWSELESLESYHKRQPRFFAQSVESLLTRWSVFLDYAAKAKGQKQTTGKPPINPIESGDPEAV